MKKRFSIFLSVCAVLALPLVASADGIKIKVYPSLAPNAFGSPSWGPWVQNAVYAIDNKLHAYGDPTQPTYYRISPHNLAINQIIVTGFPSWLGNADATNDYGTQFSSELGNRLHFGIHVWGHGQQFCIAQLGFTAVSTDQGNTLGFSFPVGSYDYSPSYVGIIHNPDGSVTVVNTPGNPFQLVDELVGRGSGNAYAVYDTPDFPGNTLQDKINNFVATITKPFDFKGTYIVGNATGSSKVHIDKAKRDRLDNDYDDDDRDDGV